MEEIEDFFVKASGKRVSFQMLYERLQGKDYGVRKGVLPLFLAWKFYLLEGMPVLYLGNKELLITVEVLNNINQFPESYDLYIEKKDMEKELYLQEMEDIFCDAQTEKIIRSNRLSVKICRNGTVPCRSIRGSVNAIRRKCSMRSEISEGY